MKILGIILLVLLVLAWLPVGVELRYDGQTLVLLRLGPLRLRVYPTKKKPAKQHKPPKKAKKPSKKKPPDSKPAPAEPRSLGGTLEAVKPLIQVAVNALQRFRHMLLFRQLTVHVTAGADNAADAAIAYGRAWAAIGALTPLVETVFRVRRRDYQAFLDYDAPQLRVLIHAHLTMFVWQLVSFAVVYGARGLRAFMQFQRKQNAPAGPPAKGGRASGAQSRKGGAEE